jgi:hypothetical protein
VRIRRGKDRLATAFAAVQYRDYWFWIDEGDWPLKPLLMVMGALEFATGLALLVSPSVPVLLLLGASFDTPGDVIVGRVAGAALVSLGVACWLARNDGHSRATRGLISAMLLYGVAAAALLAYAGVGMKMTGVALWPAVVAHVALAAWCIACLRAQWVKASTAEPAQR